MKISAVVGTPELTRPAFAVYQQDLPTAFGRLADLGYDGVELLTKDPCRLDGSSIRQLLIDHKLELTGICTSQVFGEDGLGLVGNDPTVERAAVARLQSIVDWAQQFGPGTRVNIGRSRGMGRPDDPAGTLSQMQAVFETLADYAAPKGVEFLLEPINSLQANFILTTRDGLAMVKRVNRPNFGLMLDVYHMNLEDEDMYDSLREAAKLLKLVHFTDSNRHWPGSAHLDFPRLVDVLNKIGYAGFVSLEILPWPDSDTAARSSISYLRRYIPKCQN